MKIICPEHMGLIYVDENYINEQHIPIKKVVECPVCGDEVLIEGVFNLDSEGLAFAIIK